MKKEESEIHVFDSYDKDRAFGFSSVNLMEIFFYFSVIKGNAESYFTFRFCTHVSTVFYQVCRMFTPENQ